MKVSIVLFCLFVTSVIHSDAFISIRLDSEDLDRVSDFFHSIIINQEAETLIQTPTRCMFVSLMKKTLSGIIFKYSP